MRPMRSFDLLILGGGVAGMTAAIFAARANLKTAIIEEKVCGGLVNWTNSVENFPGYISINGMELMDHVRAHVYKAGVDIDEAAEVVGLSLTGPLKVVETSEYSYSGKAIILATGREPVKLGLEDDFDHLHYCSVCDGAGYVGKKVLVVGGGNSGLDESLYLLSLGVTKIIIVEALDNCCGNEATQAKLRNYDNVEIKTSTSVVKVANEGGGCRVSLENSRDSSQESLYVDGIFVFIGQKPNTELFNDVLELDKGNYILVKSNNETNIPGVYAAGDVVQKEYRYITTAMADGTIAALAAEKYLRSKL